MAIDVQLPVLTHLPVRPTNLNGYMMEADILFNQEPLTR